MARDVLAVLVLTFPSESAFNTGGRVLDAFRSALSPKIVQTLIYTQDCLRKDSRPISIKEDLSELEVVEKELTKLGEQSLTFNCATSCKFLTRLAPESSEKLEEFVIRFFEGLQSFDDSIVLDFENQGYVLDKPLPKALPEGSLPEGRIMFEKWLEDSRKVGSIILASMTHDIQKQYDRLDDVPSIMLRMKEVYAVPDRCDPTVTSSVLRPVIINYNMNGLEKSINELINMMVKYEIMTYKSALAVLVGEALTSKAKGKRVGRWKRKKGKGKAVAATASAEGAPIAPMGKGKGKGKDSAKWRMCTDFIDLNKACPRDSYPLSWIEMLVDSIAGCALISMMDAYKGYHQIFMAEEDRDKTSFVTKNFVYCYNVMHFGIKTTSAIYQRLVNKMFKDLIGDTMEVYVDDMLVKSKRGREHILHLDKAFEIMRAYGMKLNPMKCTFGVRGGKFIGYMVSEKGIKANPEKVEAIMQLSSSKTIKEATSNRIKQSDGWLLHVGGSLNATNGGASIFLQGPEGIEIEIAMKLSLLETNNEIEYEAFILGLKTTWEGGIRQLDVYTNLQLVAMQVDGLYETTEWSIVQYLKKTKREDQKIQQMSDTSDPRRRERMSRCIVKVWGHGLRCQR
ncbi:UNVERIFIED_CONTAM: Retrovirus-related Pol polyprotein from transposon gypsy [Sesamum latifolium]|uniref:Retrovirus-related Pol polyprotein from transposon gypsy n=1 Tax=Sesamum latifolium TaxID=2727402 RepID=A0AAW2TL78_9LAMI